MPEENRTRLLKQRLVCAGESLSFFTMDQRIVIHAVSVTIATQRIADHQRPARTDPGAVGRSGSLDGKRPIVIILQRQHKTKERKVSGAPSGSDSGTCDITPSDVDNKRADHVRCRHASPRKTAEIFQPHARPDAEASTAQNSVRAWVTESLVRCVLGQQEYFSSPEFARDGVRGMRFTPPNTGNARRISSRCYNRERDESSPRP